MSKSKYVLLLNTDCIVSKNCIEKLANHIENNQKIGLICPISSVAANLSYSIPEGMNFMQVNECFEQQFFGMNFDACTVVGNCLLISRKCIDKTGYLDEIFEKGYTEETDYQFKAHDKGFLAKVAIDTYVYHQCRVSFGESNEQLEIRNKHLKIFFECWGNEYDKKMQKYKKNDPIKYINDHVNFNNCKYDFVMKINKKNIDSISKIVNNSMLNGINIKVKCKKRILDNFEGIYLFSPINKMF